jgi:hypothetical protein
MAKISARGSVKLAQASNAYTDTDGWDHKVRIALRSDGAILYAHDLRSPDRRDAYGARGWNRGGYSIQARLNKEQMSSPVTALSVFERYASARFGATLDSPR